MSSLAVPAQHRRLVLVLSPINYQRTEYDDMRNLDARSDLTIVDAGSPGRDRISQSLLRRGLLTAGSLLVQSPYAADNYSQIAAAHDAFALDKAMLFSQLCQLLGATEVRIDKITVRSLASGRETAIGADISGVASVGGGRTTTSSNRVATGVHFVDTFTGGEPDVRRARQLLRSHGLDQDPVMASLVDARAQAANSQRRRHLTLDLSAETTETVAHAASLDIPLYFGLRVDTESITHTSDSYRASYVVSF